MLVVLEGYFGTHAALSRRSRGARLLENARGQRALAAPPQSVGAGSYYQPSLAAGAALWYSPQPSGNFLARAMQTVIPS
jgi:hypothetical protein